MDNLITGKYIEVNNLSKSFYKNKFLFKDLYLSFNSGKINGIIGKNGSGKSTILKLLAGLVAINKKGNIYFYLNDIIVDDDLKNKYLTYNAPYINIYEEFTPLELINIYSKIKNIILTDELLSIFYNLMNDYNLSNYINVSINKFSSGMKQRIKLVISFTFDAEYYFFDELSTNLDLVGINITIDNILKLKSKNKVILIATNEKYEMDICDNILDLN